ncbi:phosphatase PAP2 family protein [Candidatus Roizmanbacteria bacterium]|nr:phosphatase PAP2 family protein [Candidatus Roizmanbacteria bacterium]
MNHRIMLLATGIGLFIVFLIYTYVVAREYVNQLDFDVMVRVQDNIPVRLDPFFSSFSLIGSFELTALVFSIAVIVHSWKKWRRLLILSSFFFFHVVELLFKSIIDQVGPPFMFHRYALDYHFPSTYISTDFFSYPSGHMGRTALLTGLFAYIIWKSNVSKIVKVGMWGILGGIFIVMFVSRISLGEHWFSDVVGGALLGFAFAAFSVVLW